MLILMTGGIIVILAGLSWRLIAAGMIGVALLLPPVFMFGLHDYQRRRLLTFINPEGDPSGSGYHILQSKSALGSGGLLGKGYGLGSQSQLNFLPEKQTDFIFATLAEEFGFVGCVSILLLYAAVIFMAFAGGWRCDSHRAAGDATVPAEYGQPAANSRSDRRPGGQRVSPFLSRADHRSRRSHRRRPAPRHSRREQPPTLGEPLDGHLRVLGY
jgi:hypothetical protein